MAKNDDMFGEYLSYLQTIENGVPEVMEKTMNAVLTLIFDEVIRDTPVVTGDLRRNYRKSAPTWNSSKVLHGEVFNLLEYSIYEELGHRQKKRWVPGFWNASGKFVYDPGVKTGMMLKDKWVSGSFRLTTISEKYSKKIPEIYSDVLEEWKRRNDIK